jgi:hypothetical protein
MSHELRIPYVDRNDHLSTVADLARSTLSTDEDRQVCRQLVLDGVANGVTTVGQLLDRVAALEPSGRRALLDRTRARAGLPPLSEARKTEVPPVAEEPERDALGYAFQPCAVCGVQPLSPATGAPLRTRERRWHCGKHRDQAGPRDMEPWTNGVRFAPGGALEFADDVEAEALAQRREADRHRLQHEQRRAAAARALSAVEAEARAEALAWRGANMMPTERTR